MTDVLISFAISLGLWWVFILAGLVALIYQLPQSRSDRKLPYGWGHIEDPVNRASSAGTQTEPEAEDISVRFERFATASGRTKNPDPAEKQPGQRETATQSTDRKDASDAPMCSPLHDGPSVAIVRAKRRPGFDVTRDGDSWFGGLPALGDQPWPTGRDGRLMSRWRRSALTVLRHI